MGGMVKVPSAWPLLLDASISLLSGSLSHLRNLLIVATQFVPMRHCIKTGERAEDSNPDTSGLTRVRATSGPMVGKRIPKGCFTFGIGPGLTLSSADK